MFEVRLLIKDYFKRFVAGTKLMFKEFFKKETNKKQRANMWTFSRLIIPLVTLLLSIISIITGTLSLLIISSLIAGFGAITDKLDGMSSKKYNSQSEYGKLLDQATDKYFALIVGINVAILNPLYLITLLGELIIGSINIGYKLKYKNIDISSTQIGRVKEWPLYTSLALGYLSNINSVLLIISNISIALTATFQVLTAASYIKQNNETINVLKFNNKDTEVKENEGIKNVLTIENEKNKKLTRKEEIEQLKKLKKQLDKTIENEKSYQYTKRK